MTTVTGNLQDILGEPAANFRVVFDLTRTDYESGQVTVRGSESVTADENGQFSIGLEPNEGKTQSSQYTVKVYEPTGTGRQVWSTTITVPDVASVEITTIIDEPPYPSVDAAQQAVNDAQAAAADAVIAKNEAEAAALAASNSAGDADTSAQAAQAAATAAGNAQTAAETAQAAAETAQGLAESARDDSQSARDAAQLAQTAAETARDAALAAQAAAETARDAAQAAQSASESAAALSQAWAEGIEPGGAGTKSSREHAEDAEGFKNDAETAAAKIPDPTGEDAGQLLTTNSAGEYSLDAVIGKATYRDRIIAYDFFDRAISDGNLGVSTSGHQWEDNGVAQNFAPEWVRGSAANTLQAFTNVGSIFVLAQIEINWAINTAAGLLFGADQDNHVRCLMSPTGSFEILHITGGVSTTVASGGSGASVDRHGQRRVYMLVETRGAQDGSDGLKFSVWGDGAVGTYWQAEATEVPVATWNKVGFQVRGAAATRFIVYDWRRGDQL